MTKGEQLRLREALDQVEKVLLVDDAVSTAFWDIMAATRGPDHPIGTGLKAYTVKVRRRAFPNLARLKIHEIPADFSYFFGIPPGRIDEMGDCPNHFKNHIGRAYKALGIR